MHTPVHRSMEADVKIGLQESQAFMVVIMEYCDLGSLLRAISKKAFKPHGKWSYATTYVRMLSQFVNSHCR